MTEEGILKDSYFANITLFVIFPSFSISTSTISLCFRYFRFDDIDRAVPLGVPVDIISPGSNVIALLKLCIILFTSKTRFFV